MIDKKAAKREAKEQVTAKGILAVRCTASGETWVTSAPNLKAWETSLRFGLRQGGHINKAMQSAWNSHGADSFQFEVLEEVDGDLLPIALKDLLKERQKYWREKLAAGAV